MNIVSQVQSVFNAYYRFLEEKVQELVGCPDEHGSFWPVRRSMMYLIRSMTCQVFPYTGDREMYLFSIQARCRVRLYVRTQQSFKDIN